MKNISIYEAPVEINGLLSNYHKGHLWKVPEELFGKVNDGVDIMGIRCTGGRIRFRTDSKNLHIRVILHSCTCDSNFPIIGSSACDVLRGRGIEAEYIGYAVPKAYGVLVAERDIKLPGTMDDYTIYLPRNEAVEDLEMSVDDDAQVLAPTPYTYIDPVFYYGSSITEGCSASHPSCNFVAYTARWVDADFVNFGFSGSGMGEPSMAEFLAKQKMSAFVMDYDHNADSADHLRKTHENFYKIIREAQPDLPIIMQSLCDDSFKFEKMERRDIIRQTYRNAIAAGDENVYFIDGSETYGTVGRFACTIDMLHGNDIGNRLMSERLYPVLREVLAKRYGVRPSIVVNESSSLSANINYKEVTSPTYTIDNN